MRRTIEALLPNYPSPWTMRRAPSVSGLAGAPDRPPLHAAASGGLQEPAIFSGAYNRTSWGLSSRELRVHLASGGPYEGGGYSPLQEPRVERPPFFDATTLTVAASDSCRHLRERFDAEAASLACLPSETVVESVKPPRTGGDYLHGNRSSDLTWSYGYWIHVRTDEGLEGWMHSDDLVGWQP